MAHGHPYDKEHHGKKNVQISFSCLWGSDYGSCHGSDSCSCSLNSFPPPHQLNKPPQHLPTFNHTHTPTLPPPFTPIPINNTKSLSNTHFAHTIYLQIQIWQHRSDLKESTHQVLLFSTTSSSPPSSSHPTTRSKLLF